MVKVVMSGNYDGKPLAVLSDLIRQRRKYLYESAKDAVIATGIDALVSIRRITRVSKKMLPKSAVKFAAHKPKYITAKYGKHKGKPLRRTLVKRYKNNTLKTIVKWYPLGTKKATKADREAAYKKWGKISRHGLSKWTFGVLMRGLSTRSSIPESVQNATKAIARIMAKSVMFDSDRRLTLHLTNALRYAQQSVKGGQAGVDLALKKAANKIAGRLCKVAEKKFGERVQTPFPEVKRRRAS